MTDAKLTTLTRALLELLSQHECLAGTVVYAAGKKFEMARPGKDYPENTVSELKSGTKITITPFDAQKIPCEYANKDLLTCTYEGDLYDILNYRPDSRLEKAIDELFAGYGLYKEPCYPWAFTLGIA